jgi:hypothetical protein
MPKVLKCQINDCAYNIDDICHAMAISIGDGVRPTCNTFCQYLMEAKAGDIDSIAQVGACKQSDCVHNTCLECQANEIIVSHVDDHPECMTFISSFGVDENKSQISSQKSDADSASYAPEIFIG